MNCEDFSRYIDNYENLTELEKTEMSSHAEKCEKCREELDFFMSMLASVRTLPRIEPPDDFMDKLNSRLDIEDKKLFSPQKVIAHLRRNRLRYAAAAACVAVLAVAAVNRDALFDNSNTNDALSGKTATVADNGTTPETVAPVNEVTGNIPAETAVPATEAPAQYDIPSVSAQPAENTPTTEAPHTNAQSPTTVPSESPSSPGLAAQLASAATPAPTVIPSAASSPLMKQETASTPSPAKPAETSVPKETPSQTDAPSELNTDTDDGYSMIRDDYGIALASVVRDDDTSVEYDLRASDIIGSSSGEDESIAYGRYYILDKNGNKADEAQAIGSLKISSDDADKAMDVLNQYPHDEDGNLYSTDSENLSNILDDFESEGVSYTDYTMGGSNDVKFRIVFH